MLGSLADCELDEGKAHEALPFLIESTRIFSDLGEPDEIARNLCRFARYFAADGNPLMAARLLSRSVALCGEIGATYDAPTVDDARTTIRSKLDETAFAEAWEQGRDLTVDEAVALALDA